MRCLHKPATQLGRQKTFLRYVREILVPELKSGKIVTMDNFAAHYILEVDLMIDQVGAQLLYLAPYSSDLNPIEKLWSNIKAYLRKYRALTFEGMKTALQKAFDTVTGLRLSALVCFCWILLIFYGIALKMNREKSKVTIILAVKNFNFLSFYLRKNRKDSFNYIYIKSLHKSKIKLLSKRNCRRRVQGGFVVSSVTTIIWLRWNGYYRLFSGETHILAIE